MDSMDWLPEKLLPWFACSARALPWRQDREPYHVWLSEIMLQQTRVEAARAYYLRFLAALPDVGALAAAPEETLLKLWEGLGYYSRVRNLQKAARIIAAAPGGAFPQTYEEWLALPGVGAYTAGAVMSICYDAPVAAVDGNVLRVIARLTGDDTPVDDAAYKKQVKHLLEGVYPPGHCGDFTQALMELGATVCLPAGAPKCGACPLAEHCRAKAQQRTDVLPVRRVKKPRRTEKLTVLLLYCGDRLALCRRPDAGLLAGLWQLPSQSGWLTPQQAMTAAAELGVMPLGLEQITQRRHIFTHIQWEMQGVTIRCGTEGGGFVWTTAQQRREAYPLPTAFRQFLEEEEHV